MSLTWRDGLATAVTGALTAGYVALAQGADWAPLTSVRGYAVLFLVVGQATCAVCAADLARSGLTTSPAFFLGPLTVGAALLALVTGSVTVLGVGVFAMVVLWLVTTSRHLLAGHGHGAGHHGVHA